MDDVGILYGHLVYFVVFGYILWLILWPFSIFRGHWVYFVAIWYIIWQFSTFYGHLVYYMAIWYIFPVFVSRTKENLATLNLQTKISLNCIRKIDFQDGFVVVHGVLSNDWKWACAQTVTRGLGFVGHFKSGKPHGTCWRELVGGAWIYGEVDGEGHFTGKGLFTRSVIFVSHRVVRQRLAKLGTILTESEAIVQYGMAQNMIFVSALVVRQRPAKLGSILIVPNAVE
jgi:hypothetical protein